VVGVAWYSLLAVSELSLCRVTLSRKVLLVHLQNGEIAGTLMVVLLRPEVVSYRRDALIFAILEVTLQLAVVRTREQSTRMTGRPLENDRLVSSFANTNDLSECLFVWLFVCLM